MWGSFSKISEEPEKPWYSSDDEHDSYDEGEEFDHVNPKRMTRQLNISKNYVRDWGTREAFREFFQNWKDAIIETFNLKERFRATYEENDKFVTIIVTSPHHTPQKPAYLGFIQFVKKTGKVTVVNAGAKLEPKHLQLGTTSKDTREDLAGCHGEGFKLAAMVMSRAGYKVRIESSNHNWSFGFRGPTKSQFYCTISPSKRQIPISANTAKTLSAFKSRIWYDVAVSIGPGRGTQTRKVEREDFLRWLRISLDIVEFSQPSSVIETPGGDLILDENFANKVYMKGLLLPESSSTADAFEYGYNLTQGRVNRDRERLTNSNEEARLLRSVWEAAIAQSQDVALPKYVDIFRKRPRAPDIRNADQLLSQATAEKIWKHLRAQAGESEFYYWVKEFKDATIIKESLKKKPVSVADTLWNLLRRWSLIRTPEEERIQQFRNAQEWAQPGLEFSKTIVQALKASLAMSQVTKGITVVFVDCRHSDIEVYFERDSKLLKINKDWLDFDTIHQKHPCRISEMDTEKVKGNSFVCDHIVESLYEVAIREILENLPDPRTKTDSLNKHRKELRERLRQMPRDLKVAQSSNPAELIVSWEDGETQQFSKCYGDEIQYHVVLHNEECLKEADNPLHDHNDPTIENASCGCKQKLVSQREKVATFGGLDPAQSYIPMVARDGENTFYGLPIDPVQPRRAPTPVPESQPPPFISLGLGHGYGCAMDVSDNSDDLDDSGDADYMEVTNRPDVVDNAGNENGMNDKNEQEKLALEEEKRRWEIWHREEFPKIFNRYAPRGEHGATYTRPLATFASQRLNWTFKGGQYVSVTMKSQLAPEDTPRHILRIHGIYSTEKSGSQEGKILATQYSFLHRIPIFTLEDAIAKHPEIDDKELLLHFNDVDFMGQKNDASLIAIEDITDVNPVSLDLLGPSEAVQYTVDVTEDVSNSGLFCRFAIKCGGPPDSACLMPVTNDLLPFSKHWDTPEYSPSSRPEVFDFSPGVVGLAEGFGQSGCAVRAGFGFDPVSNFTWKVRYPATAVYDGSLDGIFVRLQVTVLERTAMRSTRRAKDRNTFNPRQRN